MFLGLNGIRVGCDFPLWMQYALVAYMISFIVLFGKFYAKKYLNERLSAKRDMKTKTVIRTNKMHQSKHSKILKAE